MNKEQEYGKTGACAVMFDFDGTLVDTMEKKVENYVESFITCFSPPEGSGDVVASVFMDSAGANRFIQLEKTFQRLRLQVPDDKEELEKWSACFSRLNRENLESIREYPAVRSLLQRLRWHGFHLYLASGIINKDLKPELRRRELDGLFDCIKGGDKPGYLAEVMEKGYGYICFVGDTLYDRKIAGEAGVDFYMIECNQDLIDLEAYLLEQSRQI